MREPGHADAALDHPAFAVDPLQFAQAQQITRVIRPILRGLEGHFLILAHEGGQFERLEVIGQQHGGRHAGGFGLIGWQRHHGIAHAATPVAGVPDCDSRPM